MNDGIEQSGLECDIIIFAIVDVTDMVSLSVLFTYITVYPPSTGSPTP